MKILSKTVRSLLLASLLLSGCASHNSVGGSFVGHLPRSEATKNIAADATSCLASLYPPGHTAFHLVAPDNVWDDFSKAFETSLRAKGFTVSHTGALTVAYVLDELRTEKLSSWYLRIRVADRQGVKTITRSYGASGQPEAGFSSISTTGIAP